MFDKQFSLFTLSGLGLKFFLSKDELTGTELLLTWKQQYFAKFKVNYARCKMLQSAKLCKVHRTNREEYKTDGEKTVEHIYRAADFKFW